MGIMWYFYRLVIICLLVISFHSAATNNKPMGREDLETGITKIQEGVGVYKEVISAHNKSEEETMNGNEIIDEEIFYAEECINGTEKVCSEEEKTQARKDLELLKQMKEDNLGRLKEIRQSKKMAKRQKRSLKTDLKENKLALKAIKDAPKIKKEDMGIGDYYGCDYGCGGDCYYHDGGSDDALPLILGGLAVAGVVGAIGFAAAANSSEADYEYEKWSMAQWESQRMRDRAYDEQFLGQTVDLQTFEGQSEPQNDPYLEALLVSALTSSKNRTKKPEIKVVQVDKPKPEQKRSYDKVKTERVLMKPKPSPKIVFKPTTCLTSTKRLINCHSKYASICYDQYGNAIACQPGLKP